MGEVGDEHRICVVRFWDFWRKVPLLSLHFPWGRAGTNVGENAEMPGFENIPICRRLVCQGEYRYRVTNPIFPDNHLGIVVDDVDQRCSLCYCLGTVALLRHTTHSVCEGWGG